MLSFATFLTSDDLAIVRAIKESIPDADARSPPEVIEFVANTVGAYTAKVIEPPETPDQVRDVADSQSVAAGVGFA